MLAIALCVLCFAMLTALSNWRLGVYATVAMAFIQDPLRKLTPDEPSYFILFAALVFFAALVRAIASGMPATPNAIPIWSNHMRTIFQVFLLVLALQALQSLLRFGNPLLPILGLIEYLLPFSAMMLAYRFVAGGGTPRLQSLLWLYLALALPALATIGLEAAGFEWPILGEVGVGIHISGHGGRLIAHSGTFRSSEIAGWHAAMASCLVIILATQNRVSIVRILIAAVVVALIVGLGILTGRRKFVAMIVGFGCVYFIFVAVYIHRSRALATVATLFALVTYVGGPGTPGLETELDQARTYESEATVERSAESDYDLYVQRAGTVFGEVGGRVVGLGLAPVGWAYDRFGLFGAGLGTGAQGARFVASGLTGTGAAEGGLGKIMLDVGLPGILVIGLMLIAFARMTHSILRQCRRRSTRQCYLSCGLTALLAANAANFAVATQTYGDFFVLLFLGICVGAVLALPGLRTREASAVLPQRLSPGGLAAVRRA